MSRTTRITRLPAATDPLAKFRSTRATARRRHAADADLLGAAERTVGSEPLRFPLTVVSTAKAAALTGPRLSPHSNAVRELAAAAWGTSRHELAANGSSPHWVRAIPDAQRVLEQMTVFHLNSRDVDAAYTAAAAHEVLDEVYGRISREMGARLARNVFAIHRAAADATDGPVAS
ncbi:hypothetical protein [Cellulomonas oligotrophica]|uniref:Uncharacterized protein n=1 Tax=Cellulomonas oligotrophica TaxID=931536 RepID=A0A7Y9JZC9_9CELL|nr:hypothetical protein [Cellulomonas oligotrophica]NYD87801.1 hypothetical protein [Cellulomonas oligotrophica]GIG32994.1 hypothetical protein Col01nite_21530 [Cellulomonas oligotrophica]